ncbi:MAG: 3-isopropylmalate dehydrogenase, partial [Planctomycetes bacterium]|nr:3-isopropylmalate dehydrogenase [Planctomycetota bacterium]
GSAPDIAGQGIANPIAQILSGAMMLKYTLGYGEAADAIETAISNVLDRGIFTADLTDQKAKAVNTEDMGDAIVKELETMR